MKTLWIRIGASIMACALSSGVLAQPGSTEIKGANPFDFPQAEVMEKAVTLFKFTSETPRELSGSGQRRVPLSPREGGNLTKERANCDLASTNAQMILNQCAASSRPRENSARPPEFSRD